MTEDQSFQDPQRSLNEPSDDFSRFIPSPVTAIKKRKRIGLLLVDNPIKHPFPIVPAKETSVSIGQAGDAS